MATGGKAKPPLLAILICERALLDEDKVASLLRIVDTFNFDIEVEGPPGKQMPRTGVNIRCTVFTRWGPGAGNFTEELRVVKPDGGEVGPGPDITFKKPSGFHFQQIRRQVNLGVNQSGIYAFRVYLDAVLMGEHPFRVNINQKHIPSGQTRRQQ